MPFETRLQKAESLRQHADKINELAKDLEGEGCTIKIHCNEPFNKIDFVSIERTVKL